MIRIIARSKIKVVCEGGHRWQALGAETLHAGRKRLSPGGSRMYSIRSVRVIFRCVKCSAWKTKVRRVTCYHEKPSTDPNASLPERAPSKDGVIVVETVMPYVKR